MKKSAGFTLIELLIVVAIIAILAAIAVPNFLEAQVRAKVSRQYNNMRTTATALEMYRVDNTKYPLSTNAASFGGSKNYPRPAGVNYSSEEQWKVYPGYNGAYPGGLTTPIAYVTSNDAMEDIFRLPHNFSSELANQIMYLPSQFYFDVPATYSAQVARYGEWVIRSAGPDLYYQNMPNDRADYGTGPGGWNRNSYDATNGTVSAGDIYRSQFKPDDTSAKQ